MNQPKIRQKRERFLRLAENRTNKALKAIKVLSNCSNRSLYSYNDTEIDKIFDTLEKGISDAKARFIKKELVRFKL